MYIDFFFILFANFYLLIGVFNLFTLKVILNKVEAVSAILLFYFFSTSLLSSILSILTAFVLKKKV